MSFFLHGHPDDPLRLKNFGATTRGDKSLIKVEIETTDPYALAYALKELAATLAGQKPIETKPRKGACKAKPLALAAPARALPKPEEM